MEIRNPVTNEEWEEYYDLRYRILREPLGKERGSEKDDGDKTGFHLALFEGTSIFGVARLDHVDDFTSQARYVAIDNGMQGAGLGTLLMEALEYQANQKGYTKMILHARDYALPFYLKLGYVNHGESYKLFGVLQHYEMSKDITALN